MKISALKIENFMGLLGVHEINLADLGLVHIAGINADDPGNSSNGAGKSTILEALTWAIFGTGLPRPSGNTERGVRADEVLNDQLKRQCKVSVSLAEGDQRYSVSRWRKWKLDGRASSGVSLVVNEQPQAALDEKETDRIISKLLGMTYEIWSHGVVFGQESGFNFCDATAKQRIEILTTVMGLEQVDSWHEHCREEKRLLTNNLAEISGKVSTLRQGLERAQQNDPDLRAIEWSEQRENRVTGLRERLAKLEIVGKRLKSHQYKLPSEPEPVIFRMPPELEEAEEASRIERTRLLLIKTKADGQVQQALMRLQELRTAFSQDKCPTCWQDVAESHKASCESSASLAYAEAEKALASIVEQEQEAVSQFKAVQAQTQAIKEQAADSIAKHQQEVARFRAAQLQLSSFEQELMVARAQWRAVKEQLELAIAEENPFEQAIEKYRTMILGIQKDLVQAEYEQAQLAVDIGVCQWWDKEFPRFKSWIFDSIVDVLATEANRWLRIMSGGALWVQITATKQVGKRIKDELDIQIFRWNQDGTITSRVYRTWSGGEKRRVSLAIDLGLSHLMAQRASKAYQFLALDEIDRHLDEQGREGLREVLSQLRKERETVLVITHDASLKASFDHEITVTKDHGSIGITATNREKFLARNVFATDGD